MMCVAFSLAVTLCLVILVLSESCLPAITVATTVNIHIFEENHIILRTYNSLNLVKISLFCSATVGHTG